MVPRFKSIYLAMALAGITLAAGPAPAGDECAICDEEVVLNTPLAHCFLDRFLTLSGKAANIVIVDLSDCPLTETVDKEQDRGVIEALSMPDRARSEPRPKFIVSRAQLTCLKQRLEEGDIELDPAARIDLGGCQ